eukprot:Nitzschia sp. Nitz4//scaffold43_size134323//40929//41990//NITZ4_003291-RA/size134323-augustus-gene-0.220-mRNA-1//1//CDS//3329551924//6056//frame0
MSPASPQDSLPTSNRKKKSSTAPNDQEVNPRFKDVAETGKWGELSKTEVIVAVTVGILIMAGVIVGVTLAVKDDDASTKVTSPPTAAPVHALTPQQELVMAFDALDYSDYTYLYQLDLPTDPEDYQDLMDDPDATPQERAMSWLLYEDDWDDQIGSRWALASLYYSWGGDNWTSSEGWLSSVHHCDWEHIRCSTISKEIKEIDLAQNNLIGTIPNELVMLNETQSIWLRQNQLTGTIPAQALGSMPRLTILYLDNNHLTGTIGVELRNNDILSSLFVQSNDLTGEWPRLFCPLTSTSSAPIDNFGLDCDEVTCVQYDCCDEYNCYYDH